MNMNTMRWCLAILAVTLVPSVVCAQGTGTSWSGLDMETAGLSTVYVLDDTGVETSGKFLRLDPESIVLLVGGVEQRFEAARVRRIEKRGDSLRNGAVIGAIVGAVMGVLVAGLADCPGTDQDGGCAGARTAGVLLSTAAYAAIGTGIDAWVVGRTTLYATPPAPRRSARALFGKRIAINLSIRW